MHTGTHTHTRVRTHACTHMVSTFEQRGGRGERPHARNRAGCGGQVGPFRAHLGARVSQPPHTSQPPCSSGPGRTKPGGWRTRTLGPRVPPESPAGQDPLSKRPLECGTLSDLAGPKSPHGVWTRGVPCFSRACRAAGCWGWAAPAPETQGPGPGAARTPRRLRRLQHTFSLSCRDSPELVDVDRGDGSGGCCPRTRLPALVALREASGASTHRASAVCRAGINSVKFYARLPGAA